ncbi:MAG: restriction endonuclease subunit S [Bacteroidales bacterium]|jgi:restriction endonuclease S subunit|nr:restriction endonuclease subunit S [Bacteroidales bacterium]
MKKLLSSIAEISMEPSLRFDYNFLKCKNTNSSEVYSFFELFDMNTPSHIDTKSLYENFKYCEISNADKDGNVTPELLNFNNRSLFDEKYYAKIEKGDIISVHTDDILLSKVRPNLKKFVRITPKLMNCYFTNAFISLKPKMMPIILYYCLRGIFYQNIIAVSRQGKGYPTLNANDLAALKFDKTTIDTLQANSKAINDHILKIESAIRSKESAVKPIQSIIDEVFVHEFKLDYSTFDGLKAHKRFEVNFSMFSNNPDLRFSPKFHRDAGAFVMAQLEGITSKKIKHFLAEPIVLGASVSPNDYSDDGDYYYISMATIKNWYFDAEDAKLVSDSYSDSKKTKTVQKNDILLARSGEGTIGKVALIDNEDLSGVFADFTMRIRLTNYNTLFAYYYFRTSYFQYLVEVYKKGLGNNTNIFPVVIQEFPLPDLLLTEQQRIVDDIQAKIKKQSVIKSQIAELRSQIDVVIENSTTPPV